MICDPRKLEVRRHAFVPIRRVVPWWIGRTNRTIEFIYVWMTVNLASWMYWNTAPGGLPLPVQNRQIVCEIGIRQLPRSGKCRIAFRNRKPDDFWSGNAEKNH